MPDTTWFSEIESKVYAVVKYRMQKEISSTIRFTSDEESSTSPVFPTVFIHELKAVEQGKDLTNETINAVLSTIEIKAYSKDKSESKKLINNACTQMKKLRFDVTEMPTLSSQDGVYISVARCRRLVGACDSDLINQ